MAHEVRIRSRRRPVENLASIARPKGFLIRPLRMGGKGGGATPRVDQDRRPALDIRSSGSLFVFFQTPSVISKLSNFHLRVFNKYVIDDVVTTPCLGDFI